jgi:hypothetical protein
MTGGSHFSRSILYSCQKIPAVSFPFRRAIKFRFGIDIGRKNPSFLPIPIPALRCIYIRHSQFPTSRVDSIWKIQLYFSQSESFCVNVFAQNMGVDITFREEFN